jgi:hypothetical protein
MVHPRKAGQIFFILNKLFMDSIVEQVMVPAFIRVGQRTDGIPLRRQVSFLCKQVAAY